MLRTTLFSARLIRGAGMKRLPHYHASFSTIIQQHTTRCMSSDQETYYDSQSGQHVPIHDENKICGYLLGNRTSKSPKDIVQCSRSLGLSGSLLPPLIPQKRDVIDATAEDIWFLHLPSSLYDRLSFDEVVNGNKDIECVHLCFEYTDGSTDKLSDIIEKTRGDYGGRTSIGIFDAECYNKDPILVAAEIANIIDTTGGCSHVVLSPDDWVEPDDLRSLCEELSYLDVSGPTVKSRLVVQALNEEQTEECLNMGINKFLLADDEGESLDMLTNMVSSADKEFARRMTNQYVKTRGSSDI